MNFTQAKQEIERLGWNVLAQARHQGGRVSYDALKILPGGRWPHGRKLAVGESYKTPEAAMKSCLRACIVRDLPHARRRQVAA